MDEGAWGLIPSNANTKPNHTKKDFSSQLLELLVFPVVYNFIMKYDILFNTKSTWTGEQKGSNFVPGQHSHSSGMYWETTG